MANRPGKRRRDPLFDLPQARANYRRACQLPRFTIDEASALLVGLNPEFVTPTRIAAFPDHGKMRDLEWLRTKLLPRGLTPDEKDSGITPDRLLEVLQETGFRAPVAFVRSLEARARRADGPQATLEVQQLQARIQELERDASTTNTRRYNTGLKVIRAVAVAKYDHQPGAARSPAPKLMSEDTGEGRGRVSDDTIRDLLREAEEIIEAEPNSDMS